MFGPSQQNFAAQQRSPTPAEEPAAALRTWWRIEHRVGGTLSPKMGTGFEVLKIRALPFARL